jgi:hypothetical protein
MARFRRKTRGYSKSEEMLRITIALFIAKRNGNLSIFGY